MAKLTKSDGKIHLNFTLLEVLGAFHESLSAPEEWIESITYSDKPWSEIGRAHV